jgi:Do/DeqQ family serine protease
MERNLEDMSNVVQFRRSTAILTLVAASIGGGLIAAFAVATHSNAPVSVVARADNNPNTPVVTGDLPTQLSNSFANVIEKASPAVVKISMTRIIKAQQSNNPLLSDPFFRQFFGGGGMPQRPQNQREEGLGSGIIVNPSGYILTNNHVVDKASSLLVTLSDGRDYPAKTIGTDPQTDVAVVKIDASNLPTLPFANSDAARVGDLVFAIGNPFGEDHTVTMGIVSAKNRVLERGLSLQNFIQTDAAINPGNSGGALINAKGDLIGMNTMILTGGSSFGGEGGNIGIGFAVPSNMAKNVMDQLIKNGKVSRGYMGVFLQELTPALAQQFGLKNAEGALVGSISPNSPGEKAGMKTGDVITGIDGKQVKNADELTADVISHEPGSTVTLNIIRDGKPMTLHVTLGRRPTGLQEANNGQGNNNEPGTDNGSDNGTVTERGITVEALTPDIAQQIGVPASTKGVVVSNVDQASPAADAPLQQGSVIVAVDRHSVANVGEFRQLMQAANSKPVLLTINNGGQVTFAVVQPK